MACTQEVFYRRDVLLQSPGAGAQTNSMIVCCVWVRAGAAGGADGRDCEVRTGAAVGPTDRSAALHAGADLPTVKPHQCMRYA